MTQGSPFEQGQKGRENEQSAVPVVRGITGIVENEDKEKQGWQVNAVVCEDELRSADENPTKRHAQQNQKARIDPCVDSKDAKQDRIEDVSTGHDKFEKIPIGDLTVHHPFGVFKEENRIILNSQWNGWQEKCSQIEKNARGSQQACTPHIEGCIVLGDTMNSRHARSP